MTSEIEALALHAIHGTDGWGMIGRDRRHLHERVARTILSAITASQAEVERLTRERDALKLQAQCWAMEARGQKATVQEAYQAVTGATGEPGDWNGARPIRDALQAAEARATRAEALVEEAEEWERRCANVEAVLSSLSKAAWRVVNARDAFRSPDRTNHPNLVLEEAEAWIALREALDGKLPRATRAEGLLEEAGEVSNRLLAWANRRCPCYDDSPSPCPLCGARVDATDENGVCKAAEYTVPGDLLQAARAFLDKLKAQG